MRIGVPVIMGPVGRFNISFVSLTDVAIYVCTLRGMLSGTEVVQGAMKTYKLVG